MTQSKKLNSAEVFYTIFEQTPISTQIFSPDGETIMVNKAWEKLWNTAFEQLKQYNILKDKQLVEKGIMKLIKKAFQGEIVILPAIRYEPSKTVNIPGIVPFRWVSAIMYPIKNNTGKPEYLVLQHTDITDQKEAEEKLIKSEQLFKSITENSLDGVRLIDEKANILYASPSTSRILGYSVDEYKKINLYEIIHPENKGQYRKLIQDLLKHPKKTVSLRYRMLHKNGQWRWIEGSGRNFLHNPNINALISNYRDVTEQKEAEDKLWDTNQTLKTIIQASPLAVYVLDMSGKVILWSAVAEKMFGWTEKEVTGKTLPIVQPKMKPQFKKLMQTLLAGKSFTKETVRRRKNGSVFDVSISAAPIFDEEGEVSSIVAITSDISEQKQYEREMQQYITLLKSIPDAVISVNMKYKITSWNKGAEELYGFTEKEVLGKFVLSIVKNEYLDGPKELKQIGKQLFSTGVWEGETIQYKKDGTKFYAFSSVSLVKNNNGKNIGVVSITHDVTERKLTEELIRDQEERLRLALDAGKIGVWDWDISTNKITWSQKVYEIHEIEEDKFKGNLQDYTMEIHPHDKERVSLAIQDALKNKNTYDIEFRIITPKGNTKWIHTSAQVIFHKGKPVRMLGATTDITQRKELERQKDDFMAIASHELKTPVTSTKAYAQVLEKRFLKAGDLESAELLRKMHGQINKLSSLIQDLLDVTKIQGGKIEMHKDDFILNEIVEETIEEVQRTTDKHSIIKKGNSQLVITGDKYRIGQVVMNFLTNAVKYSPNSNKIIVSIKSTKKEVTVSVQDFGMGIPKDSRLHIFDRFFRVNSPTHATIPGIGLGMYISAEIINRHKGKIWFKSEVGKGSTFYFSLPLSS